VSIFPPPFSFFDFTFSNSNGILSSSLRGFNSKLLIGKKLREAFPSVPDDDLKAYYQVALTGIDKFLGEFEYGDERVKKVPICLFFFSLHSSKKSY
jgi:hypothetical protein